MIWEVLQKSLERGCQWKLILDRVFWWLLKHLQTADSQHFASLGQNWFFSAFDSPIFRLDAEMGVVSSCHSCSLPFGSETCPIRLWTYELTDSGHGPTCWPNPGVLHFLSLKKKRDDLFPRKLTMKPEDDSFWKEIHRPNPLHLPVRVSSLWAWNGWSFQWTMFRPGWQRCGPKDVERGRFRGPVCRFSK